ncbi:neuronal acetylcholine receptor subunit alpha-9-like [Branchiostoma floridae]|uniref:Neuronal acetylcholine receptor subunit alpha-9-like n=1 Tax=Branchiostoma floridae TaxID=7739 RepID=A0A9J7LA37_BRAFL|nr:neuronal acetylcholine receptor subunit alpha-9-like [Branchiostoma floridae]
MRSHRKAANPLHQGLPKDVPVRVSSTGLVQWRVETLTTTVCEANPFLFPADTMECEVCFSATTAIEQTIQCHEGGSTSDVRHPCGSFSTPIAEGEWYRSDKIFEQNQTEACFALQLSRIPTFHIATTVGPCIILIVLMTITFIMPIGEGDRISFGVTIQLSMVVSLVFVTEVLPVKGALPFFATLIIVCMGLMGLFLFLTMAVIFIHGKEGSLSPLARVIFLRYTARVLLLGDLTEDKQASTGTAAADDPRTNIALDDDMVAEDGGSAPEIWLWGGAKSRMIRRAFKPPTGRRSTGSSGENEMTKAVKKGSEDLVQAVKIGMVELKDEMKIGRAELKDEMKKLTKAVKNEEVVSDYTLLAKVLDRLCLMILYVISIVAAIPLTRYLSR